MQDTPNLSVFGRCGLELSTVYGAPIKSVSRCRSSRLKLVFRKAAICKQGKTHLHKLRWFVWCSQSRTQKKKLQTTLLWIRQGPIGINESVAILHWRPIFFIVLLELCCAGQTMAITLCMYMYFMIYLTYRTVSGKYLVRNKILKKAVKKTSAFVQIGQFDNE